MTTTHRRVLARWLEREWLLAGAVFLVLGSIYVMTLLPGLGGTEDTPKFQYVGPALGTPHNPGYPLYMLVSWAFSKVPIGILAYRINLLSAFWGAVAGALACVALCRLQTPRAIAVLVALALGLGRAFWEHSTYAEVYTQACAFIAAALLALITWEQRGRERYLYLAVAATSLGFGTHLITVGLVPICLWLVITRYRLQLPVRVILVSGAIVLMGIAQYGYVWVRTVQGARYVESRAETFRDLINVLRGEQFENQTFRESPGVIARTRLPAIGRAAYTELGPLACGAAVLGVFALWRRQRRVAILLVGAFAGPVLLLANLGEVATSGILLPALLPIWMLVGVGLAALWSPLRVVGHTLTRLGSVTAALLAVALPISQFDANLSYNNRRHETYDTDYFADLFSRLQGATALVDEDYIVGHMLEYERYVTGRRDVQPVLDRDPSLIADRLSRSVEVYGFSRGVAALDGLIRTQPVTLSASSLDARLARAADGLIVVVAGSADRWPTLGAIGVQTTSNRAGRGVVIGVKGAGPVIVTETGFEGVVEIRRGERLGRTALTAPFDLRIEVHGREAEIAIDANPVIRTTQGLAVTEMTGGLEAAYELTPGNGLRPPLDMSRRPLYRVTDVVEETACTFTGGGTWARLIDPGSGGRLVGRVDNYNAFDTRWVVYLGSLHPLPAHLAAWFGPGRPSLVVESFVQGADDARLHERLSEDRAVVDPSLFSAPVVTRLGVTVNDVGQSSTFRLNLGGQPTMGWGWTTNDRADRKRGRVCAAPAEWLKPDSETAQASIYLGPGWDWVFGSGWEEADLNTAGFFRRVRGVRSTLLLPIEQPDAITIRLSAAPEDGAVAVAVTLNGQPQGAIPLGPGWNDLAWTIAASAWRAGVNELSFEIRGAAATPPASLKVRRLVLDWSHVGSS